MKPAAVLTTRPGQFLILEVALPGVEPDAAGVLLLDPEAGLLSVRLRRDWSHIAGPQEAEVLSQVQPDLEGKIHELGAGPLLEWMEDSLSNLIRVSERRSVLLADFDATLNRLYREHVGATILRFETHLPLYSCRAAAGRWGDQMEVAEEGWVEAPVPLSLTGPMFVARVVGRSMEPRIPDGSLCIFRGNVIGSRQGKLLLVENFGESEQGGQRYTVKRYHSRKVETDEGDWRHQSIRLEPLNPEFEAWELEEGAQCRVIAEFLRLLD